MAILKVLYRVMKPYSKRNFTVDTFTLKTKFKTLNMPIGHTRIPQN